MGILDRLFGRREEAALGNQPMSRSDPGGSYQPGSMSDEQALERYRYMLRTAPPETIEQAHEEAFSRLTPEQREQVLRELTEVTPEAERAALAGQDDPKSLARLATRAEMREPGVMERVFARPGMTTGMGMGMGGMIFSSMLAGFVGSMIAQEFFGSMGDADFGQEGWGDQSAGDQVVDTPDTDFVGGSDFGGGADFGGGFGGDV
jgi:hypothetical protein